MSLIRVLPEQIANQIAAGEVVERPASVVKELVENALDAGASRIDIEIEGGGADRIRVADDGSGMDRDDAITALQRHATSKIQVAEDLSAIHSFGFRGEALPSIASVSCLTLTTSRQASAGGARVRVLRGGRAIAEPAPHPRGTTVEVEGLFQNAPARRKFLRSKGTETAHIMERLTRIAAAHPAIGFSIRSGGREQASWPAVGSHRDRMVQLVGPAQASHLVEVRRSEGRTRVTGLASSPALHRSTGKDQALYVNARPIRDRRLLHAVQQAYATLLPRGRYPLLYLFLEIPPDEVDVNVHPAKSEVRFLRAAAVHDLVRQALLEAHGLARPLQQIPSAAFEVSEPNANEPIAPGVRLENQPAPPVPGQSGGAASPPAQVPLDLVEVAPLAQFRETYILAAAPDGLVILDQHAAHERVLYERFRDAADSGRVERQKLLFPSILEVSAAQRQAFEDVADLFDSLGFGIVPFGEGAVRIDEVPAMVPADASRRLVPEMLDEVLQWGKVESPEKLRERLAASSACHAAVRANHPLGLAQMRQIVGDLLRSRQPMTCPHGRPALLRFPLARLEREFRRR